MTTCHVWFPTQGGHGVSVPIRSACVMLYHGWLMLVIYHFHRFLIHCWLLPLVARRSLHVVLIHHPQQCQATIETIAAMKTKATMKTEAACAGDTCWNIEFSRCLNEMRPTPINGYQQRVSVGKPLVNASHVAVWGSGRRSHIEE